MNYKRAPQKFVCLGMDLNRPVDLLPPGKYPLLKNVHSYQEGRLETRGPMADVTVTPSTPDINIISSFFMNDYVTNLFERFLKIGNSLYYGDTSYTLLDTGYSALPFSPVSYRPDQSARPWAYLGDPFKMRKANTSGTNAPVGVTPPTVIPTAELGVPLYFAPTEFDAATGWTGQDSAGSVSLVARLTSVTVDVILYDTGTTGWACVAPTGGNFADITAGMRIIVNAEEATVEDIHKPYQASGNTVAQIIYDSGTTGLCTVQPTLAVTNLNRNTLISVGGEYVRIISVTAAQNGINSFRCVTTGARAAGDAIVTPAGGSFRVYLTGTHSAGDALTANALASAITITGTMGGDGILAYNYGAGSGINLGNIGNVPIGPSDYIHFSVWMDDPSQLVELRMILDVDSKTTSTFAAADGTENAYYLSITGNNFQPVIAGTGTTNSSLAASLLLQEQNAVIANFATNQSGDATAPPSSQLNLGNSQWTEVRVPLAQLIRIGAAQGLDLSAVNAIQFKFLVSNTCNVQVGNLWVGGGYGPDTSTNLTPFIYRFRYRSSETGAHSLPGPAMREGITSLRQQVNVTVTASTEAQVDKIDIERFGGTNTDGWHYLATVANTTAAYADQQLSAAILVNPPLDTSAYQPFPISDVPRSFTATIAGTAILRTGGTDNVNPAWAIGTEIIVNSQVTTVYAPPIGTTAGIVQVADSIPPGTNVLVQINEPVLAGQPLPYLFGPFSERLFAVGNVLDGGSLYFTNPGDPDSAPNSNRVECCSPSEALVHGCVYDGRCYVFSDQRMFAIIPSFQASSQFDVVPVPNSRGLWAPYALAVGPRIWFLAADGIYESDGGSLVKISTDIDPLFPNGDRLGYAVNGLFPVQMAAAGDASQIAYLRLTYWNGELFFDYKDCNGDPNTLCYDLKDKAWYQYVYFEGTSTVVNFHSTEQGFQDNDALATLVVGTNQGRLYKFSGTGSGVETINCKIRTPALDVGDSRAKKIYGDIVYDFDTQGFDVVCTPYINNYQTALATDTVNSAVRQMSPPQDLSAGAGQFARNIGVEITWTLST